MCLAIFKPKGVQIAKKYLRNGFDANDDGAGFAIAKNGKVEIYKGYFKFGDFWKAFKPFQAHTAIIHFRLSTHGKITPENCHPFPLLNDQFALIHNGILDIKCNKNKDLSDTWHFTELVLSPLLENNVPDSPAFRYVIEQAIGAHNKLVLLRGDGGHVIFNEKAGHWHKGAWWSNDGYKHDRSWWGLGGSLGGSLGGYCAGEGIGWPDGRKADSSYADWDTKQLPSHYKAKSRTSRQYWAERESFPDYVPSCDRELEAYLEDQEEQLRLMNAYELNEADSLDKDEQ